MSYLIPIYERLPLRADRGQGVWLYDEDGTKYLDAGCGYAVVGLGHCHPDLVAALTEQAQKLWHCSNGYHIPGQEILAERLCKHSFGKAVFFCNSGVEAWEASIKIARKYFHEKGEGHRYRGIVLEGCFHGRTFAAISAAKRAYMIDGFEPLLDGFDQVKPGDLAALEAAITSETAFICLEPVMGEGGMAALTPEYLQGVRALCDKHGLLLVMDEVQCGMGRTGKLFAHEWAGIVPDIMAIAKAIGGGFPMGAYIVGEKCKNALNPGSHGTTFGGNPMAMAIGNAVLDIMTAPGFFEHVNAMAQRLEDGLRILTEEFPQILTPELRGKGLMRAIQCQPDLENKAFMKACFGQQLLVLPAGQNVVRIMPALIARADEIDEILTRLQRACQVLKA